MGVDPGVRGRFPAERLVLPVEWSIGATSAVITGGLTALAAQRRSGSVLAERRTVRSCVRRVEDQPRARRVVLVDLQHYRLAAGRIVTLAKQGKRPPSIAEHPPPMLVHRLPTRVAGFH